MVLLKHDSLYDALPFICLKLFIAYAIIFIHIAYAIFIFEHLTIFILLMLANSQLSTQIFIANLMAVNFISIPVHPATSSFINIIYFF